MSGEEHGVRRREGDAQGLTTQQGRQPPAAPPWRRVAFGRRRKRCRRHGCGRRHSWPARSSTSSAAAASASAIVGLAEDHRLRVLVAEGLPDLDAVGHVGHLDRPGRLRGERLVVGVGLEVVGVRRLDAVPHRHLAGVLQQRAVLLLTGGELQDLPGRPLRLAGGVDGDVLGVGERVGLLGRCAAGGRDRGGPPVDVLAVHSDGPRADDRHGGLAVGEGVAVVLLVLRVPLVVHRLPELGDSLAFGRVERRLPVLDELRAARLGGVEGVEVEPRLEELAGGSRPDRGLGGTAGHDLLAGREELVVRRERRVLRVDPGLLHQVLVVEDHHGVGLPRELVVLAVRRLVLLGRVAGALLDVLLAVGEAVEGHQPTLLLELRDRRGRGVEHQARRVAGGDRGADHLLGRLPGGDLLGGDLFVGVLRVPGVDHLLAPGDLLGVVRQPDLDGARGAGGARAAARHRRRRSRRLRRSGRTRG